MANTAEPLLEMVTEMNAEGADATVQRRAEEILCAALEGSMDAVFVLACERGPDDRVEDFRFIELNRNGAALIGLKPAEVRGRRLCELLPVNRSGGFFDRYVRVVESGEPLEEEFPVHLGDKDVWLRHRVVRAGDGVVITTRDVTGRRGEESDQRQNKELLRMVIDNIPCGVFWKDRDSVYLGCNDLFARNHDLPGPAAVVGRNDVGLGTAPAEAEAFRAEDRRVVETGESRLGIEEVLTRPDGSQVAMLTSKVPLRNAGGAVVGVLGVYQDITNRKRAEEEMRGRDERLSAQQTALLELGRDVLRGGPPDAAIRRLTEATARALGVARVSVWRHTPDYRAIRCADLYEASGERHSAGTELSATAYPAYFRALEERDVIPAHDAPADPCTREFADAYLVPLGIGALLDVPLRPFGRLEGVLCCEHVGPPRRWEPDEQVFAMAVGNLVSLAQERWERERAEDAVRAWNARYEAVVKATGQVIYDWDTTTGRLWWGGNCEATLGRPPGEMPTDLSAWSDLIHPDDRARAAAEVERVTATGSPFRLEYRIRRQDGAYIVVSDQGHFLSAPGERSNRMVGLLWDVTARKRLEEQVRQGQKMEAVGRLAGGVAHDFNNLLTVINGYADVAAESLAPSDPVRALVEQVRKAGDRAAGLTRQLLAYGRKQILQQRVFDLNAVVSDLSVMLRRLIGEDIDLLVRLATKPQRVQADPGQVEQVVVNLAVNARDAMPRGGRLTIQTERVVLADHQTEDGRVVSGSFVVVAVTDTGAGIPDAVRAHIFEPFFTTKSLGQGTGLGLATVYGIVAQSGGHIEVQTAVGVGTTFRVYLPAVGAAEPERVSGEDAPPRGTETVLVAEDEPGVRGLAELALRQLGYTVRTAANGDVAMAVARAAPKIDLLLTDVVMPGGGGRELAERLRRERPQLRVVYMSGYTDDAVVRHGVECERVEFLQKPFTPAALAHKVRAALDQRN